MEDRLAPSLSHLDIQDITQDEQGNMWFATLSGLDRYNGYEYRHFLHDPADSGSISHNFVFSVSSDDNGYLWVGTAIGLDRYDLQYERFEHFQSLISPVYHLFRDSAGRVWTATPGGAGLTEPENRRIVYPFGNAPVNVLWEDSYHRIWAGQDDGLVLLDTKEHFSLPGERSVLCQYTDSQGLWWLGTDQGIFRFNPVTGTVTDGPESLPELARDRINFIQENEPSKLVIGTTTDGLFQYDLISKKLLHNQPVRLNPGRSAEVNVCYLDRQGNTWIGTYDKGFFFGNRQADLFNNDEILAEGLKDKFVTRLMPDRNGHLWIATRYDGLYRYDLDEKLTKIDLGSVLPGRGEFFEVCYADAANRLWLAFESTLVVATIRGDKAYPIKRMDLGHVRCIDADSDGTVWVGSFDGLHRVDGRTLEVRQIPVGEGFQNIATILNVEDGILFSPYGNGVRHLDTKTLETRPLEVPAEAQDVNLACITLARDSRGRIWMGSYGAGVACCSGDKAVRFTTQDGLPNINVLSIQEDFSGNIWVSTLQGIARIRFPENASKGRISVFPGHQFHEKSGCRTTDGRIFFGGNHGLTFFDPSRFPQTRPAPVIHLEDLQIWGHSVQPSSEGSVLTRSISYTDRIVLSHRQNSISLDWAGIDYYSSNNLTYKYRLDGFDRNWNHVGTFRRASWSNLPPGNYTFEVIAVADEGMESLPATLRITVRRAPWLQWWAILCYILLISAIAFAVLRSLMNARLESQRAELERSEKEREREISQMKTVFFTNISHELRTPLTLINAPLERLLAKQGNDRETAGLLDAIHRNSSRMMMLMNQLMDFSKIENGVYSLAVRHTDINRIIRETCDSFQFTAEKKGIRLTFQPESAVRMMWADSDKLVKILDNLLSNAVKHTPEGGSIQVITRLADDTSSYADDVPDGSYLEISVLDTGDGVPEDKLDQLFVRYRLIESQGGKRPDYSGNGIGLHYTKNMVEKHHGKIHALRRKSGGMDFSFILPLDDVYTDQEKVLDSSSPGMSEPAKSSPITSGRQKERTILVVEDNTELREFICGLLAPSYRVMEAPDGLQAWSMLSAQKPDLVVSDVIMPEMSGYELCSQIKGHPDFCHIPVILLTAKTSAQEQVEGLQNGADAYICKPFHVEYLIMTIRNQLRMRDALQAYFTQPQTDTNPLSDIDLPSGDQSFLDKLTALMEENLANPDLNIDFLAHEMGYSRTAFYLRIKGITRNAPNDFVRDYRFKRAAEAIRAGKASLSEIAEQTGFSSYSYFSKAFKKHFGISPKAWQSQQRNT